ncbi:MAG TPA: trypsin-like serine protease [Polyangiaceae bacterium]
MTETLRKSLAEIEVTVSDGAGAGDGRAGAAGRQRAKRGHIERSSEATYRYATGIPVDTDRIVTVHHVLGDGAVAIRVRFPRLSRERWHDAEVIWPPSAQRNPTRALDVVVLQIADPPPELGFAILSTRAPSRDVRFWSEAFPHGAVRDANGHLEPQPLNGNVKAPPIKVGDRWELLQLKLDGEPDEREQWQGASGGPVFVGDELCGILCAVQSNWRESLMAVPVAALLEDAGFVDATGVQRRRGEERERYIEEVSRDLVDLFKAQAKAAEALAEFAKLSSTDAKVLVPSLMRLELERFAAVCNRAHDRLSRRGQLDAAGAIVGALFRLAPVLVKAGLVEALIRFGRGTLIVLPVVTPTMLELVAAAADQRAFWPSPPRRQRDLLRSEAELSRGVETGKGGAVDVIRDHLLKQLVPEELIGQAGNDAERKAERDRRLNVALARLADPDKTARPFRYFYVYDRSEAQVAVAQELNERFPDIRTVAPTGGAREKDEEQELNSILVELLLRHYRRHETEHEEPDSR